MHLVEHVELLIKMIQLYPLLELILKQLRLLMKLKIEKKIKMLVNEISLGKNTTNYLRCTVWILSFF